jgi:hypothetical protein
VHTNVGTSITYRVANSTDKHAHTTKAGQWASRNVTIGGDENEFYWAAGVRAKGVGDSLGLGCC